MIVSEGFLIPSTGCRMMDRKQHIVFRNVSRKEIRKKIPGVVRLGHSKHFSFHFHYIVVSIKIDFVSRTRQTQQLHLTPMLLELKQTVNNTVTKTARDQN